ncbi:MAG: NAD-dependent epimerase/dehydratase family protein [Bacteroidia bacterium]|nr:NAD-dependent epimerase/dehydratase family protein [Bacteroidia bacterium]
MNKILILGGTQFIGRNLVNVLQSISSYDLTLFNRQQTASNLFPKLNKIKGDRETDDIRQIEQQAWDYVIDLSCYYPAALQKTLSSLKIQPKKYIFISTCSVYNNENNKTELRDESAELLPCTIEQATNRESSSYGNRKAECERILIKSGLNYTIFRPALVYGAYDKTDRFYYWLYQVRKSPTLLLPNKGNSNFSITYVQDLVNLIIASLNNDSSNNTYNAISTPKTSISQIVNAAAELLEVNIKSVKAHPDFLEEQNIAQWKGIPLWLNCDYYTYSNQKIQSDYKIALTNFSESIKQTIVHYSDLNWPTPGFGITDNKKNELIDKILAEQTH